jgi:uncharacterized protein
MSAPARYPQTTTRLIAAGAEDALFGVGMLGESGPGRAGCDSLAMPDRDGDALAHSPLARQTAALEAIVRTNPVVAVLLDRLHGLGIPSWYVGAGAIAQTVWNHLHGFPPTHGITDYDVVYHDPRDLTETGESRVRSTVTARIGGDGVKLDLTNQARVHLWYERRFGRALAPYRSVEHAIATLPTTATSIGVRSDHDGFIVCAPFGLADVFAMVVRPNTTLIDRAVYEEKAGRWRRRWPRLTVLPWPH